MRAEPKGSDFNEVAEKWLAAKESKRLREDELVGVWTDPHEEYLRYECPCGGGDHYALRFYFPNEENPRQRTTELSPVMNCFRHNKQWLVCLPRVESVILAEELAYFKLVKNAPPIVAKIVRKSGWNDETAAFLYDTHGIDRELAELIVQTDLPELWPTKRPNSPSFRG